MLSSHGWLSPFWRQEPLAVEEPERLPRNQEAALHSILLANNRDPDRSAEGPNFAAPRNARHRLLVRIFELSFDDMTLSIPTLSH